MHYMKESATDGLGARERRRRETYASLTNHARTLTADRGLNGFTIKELCDGVGVSRRTFFNYFATKEDAILGAKSADPLEPFAQAFLDSGPAAAADGSGSASPLPLKNALLELFVAAFATLEIPRTDVRAFMQAMHAEPALMKRMVDSALQRQRVLAELIVRREGMEPGDPFADLASTLCSHLSMTSFQQFVGRSDACEAENGSPAPHGPPADDEETSGEALERFTGILRANFAHAARLFGA